MLKKIAITELRLGMYVHKLDGKWLEHPFWKSRFVLESTDDLQRLRSSGLAQCWIDVRRGPDVASAFEPDSAATPARVVPAAALPRLSPVAAPQCPMPHELKAAAAIFNRGREAVMAMFNEARMGHTVDAEGCLPLVDDIANSMQRNPGALVSLARLKTRDDYTYLHSVAVCALMVALARRLGMDEGQCRQAGLAGLMHDIGKALVPLEVLNKPGPLTDAEYTIVRGHPEAGRCLLQEGQGATPEMLDVVLHHHERADGAGYPHRLSADQISQLARMGAICDVYDAITSNRPYKAGWDPAESIARMASWKGQFDTALFAAFVQSLGIYPTGSLVKLDSNRLAVVVEQNPGQLVAPVVTAFYSLRAQMRIAPRRLDVSRPDCQDRIVGRHVDEGAAFTGLNELWAGPDVLRRCGF